MNRPKLKIAVFASGYGSNFEAIAKACQSGELEAEVVLMVCDKPTARVNALADELGVERMTFSAKDYADADDFYYDHYDDFYDYEDAEDYYNEHAGK